MCKNMYWKAGTNLAELPEKNAQPAADCQRLAARERSCITQDQLRGSRKRIQHNQFIQVALDYKKLANAGNSVERPIFAEKKNRLW